MGRCYICFNLLTHAVNLYIITAGANSGITMSLILGIDPGSRKTGFGIINYHAGRSEYVTSGIIRLPETALPERLRIIYDSVTELVNTHCPQQLAIEQGAFFEGKSRRSENPIADAPKSSERSNGLGVSSQTNGNGLAAPSLNGKTENSAVDTLLSGN